ncbi:MAG: serine hydrolase [Phycisphaeraceae bacterium]|nr:serine hydrolase [Phycisphaeraceae bacterium]
MRLKYLTGWIVIALMVFVVSYATTPLHAQTWPGAAWETATPESVGLSSQALQYAQTFATTEGSSTGGSGYVIKNGKLVWSWGSATQTYDITSVTKSFGSTALGLAIGQGLVSLYVPAQIYLPSVGTPPATNLSEHADWLSLLSLYDLVSHTAGFTKPGDFTPIVFQPGNMWYYSDSGFNWLADVLTVSFGADLLSEMTSEVFVRIGVQSGQLTWRGNLFRTSQIEDPGAPGVFYTRRELAGGISASVDALARLGYLWLHDGQWNGQQIIPASYVAQARLPLLIDSGALPVDPSQPGAALYGGEAPLHIGLGWWNNFDGVMSQVPTDAYWGWGENDNLLIVIPSMDLVVVRTGISGQRWDPSGTQDYISVIEPFFNLLLGNTQPPPTPEGLPGDANNDGLVDVADLQILVDNWLSQDATWTDGDFNGDGVVDLADLQLLGDFWGIGLLGDLPGLLPGDANIDGLVNLSDLQILSDNWLTEDATWLMGEFSGNGVVDLADLQILTENWTDQTPPDLSVLDLKQP